MLTTFPPTKFSLLSRRWDARTDHLVVFGHDEASESDSFFMLDKRQLRAVADTHRHLIGGGPHDPVARLMRAIEACAPGLSKVAEYEHIATVSASKVVMHQHLIFMQVSLDHETQERLKVKLGLWPLQFSPMFEKIVGRDVAGIVRRKVNDVMTACLAA